MRIVQCLDGFQFNHERIFNQEVGEIFADDHVVIEHLDTGLLRNLEAS